MNWLRQVLNPIHKTTSIGSKIFVFDEQSEAIEYAELLTSIEQSPNLELIEIVENWDQVGILTKLVTYRIRN